MSAREATIGEKVKIDHRAHVDQAPHHEDVRPFCDPESRLGGNWYCSTCQRGFVHNSASSLHAEEPGDHIMVWVCREHGPEARP